MSAKALLVMAGVCSCSTVSLADGKDEIDSTLAAMSRAVLSADEPAFLSFIGQDDPLFATEWRHWADQLKDSKPAEFSLSIGEGPSTFTDTRAEFPLVMSWLITTGPKESWGAGGTTRTVTFPPVVFAKVDPDAEGPLPALWVFRGEKWERLDEAGFSVLYLPGSEAVAHDVARAFPVARDHDNEGFQVTPPPQVLKLYTSMDHLRATVYLNMPDAYLGGWSEPGESIKFMTTYTAGVPQWTNAYAHEYGHVCTWTVGPHAKDGPWWLEEGVAELAAQEYRPGYWDHLDHQMRNAAKLGQLAAWPDISNYLTTKPGLKHWAYLQGNHMVGYISVRWGREGRNRWLHSMIADGKSLDDATREILGMPFDQLDREWRQDLLDRAKADAPAKPADHP